MNRFMKRAIELSIQRMKEGHGGPFGAVVVKNGEIIAEGFNVVLSTNDPTAHAEVQAIRAACEKLGTFQLDGCEVYTSCEPCPMCLGAIYWARPDRVYFAASRVDAAAAGFDDDMIYREIQLKPRDRGIPFLSDADSAPAARQAFDEWKKKQDKVQY